MIYLLLPASVAGIAVLTRSARRTIQWILGCFVAGVLTVLWFRIAIHPIQPVTSFLFVVVIPVGATFWVGSLRRFTPLTAFGPATVTCLATAVFAVFLGVNMGMVRP
jgi:hypothetical protein